jgi:hypothetical protein
MNKIRTILIAVLAMALMAPVVAGAKDKPAKADKPAKTHKAKKAKNAEFKGTVVSVDVATGTVVVKVEKASKWGRRFKGQDVAFTTAGVKKIKVADTNGDGKKDLNDVKAGDRAHVGAKITKDAVAPLAARKFHAKAPKAREPAPTAAPTV